MNSPRRSMLANQNPDSSRLAYSPRRTTRYREELYIHGSLFARYTLEQWMIYGHLRYWSVSECAAAWGVTYSGASMWMRRHPRARIGVDLVHPDGRVSRRYMVHAGIHREQCSDVERGNPNFRISAYQRQLVLRRWSRQRPDSLAAASMIADAERHPPHVPDADTPPWGD